MDKLSEEKLKLYDEREELANLIARCQNRAQVINQRLMEIKNAQNSNAQLAAGPDDTPDGSGEQGNAELPAD